MSYATKAATRIQPYAMPVRHMTAGETRLRETLAFERRQPPGQSYGISDLSSQFGITMRALRFYESKGLLQPTRQGQQRFYSEQDRIRLALILKGKQLGFTLAEIREIVAQTGESGGEELRMSVERVQEQIAHLEEQHRSIDTALAELRRRLYLMSDVDSEDANLDAFEED